MIREKYDYVGDPYEGLARVRLGDKWGHVNEVGEVTTPLIYDGAGNFCRGLACVRLDNKWGHVNTAGEVIWTGRDSK